MGFPCQLIRDVGGLEVQVGVEANAAQERLDDRLISFEPAGVLQHPHKDFARLLQRVVFGGKRREGSQVSKEPEGLKLLRGMFPRQCVA